MIANGCKWLVLTTVSGFTLLVNVNDWLLYSLDSPAAEGARGYTRGSVYGEGGQLVASCMQEGLIRLHS